MIVFVLKMPFIAETCCQCLFANKFDLYLFLYLLLYFNHNGDSLPKNWLYYFISMTSVHLWMFNYITKLKLTKWQMYLNVSKCCRSLCNLLLLHYEVWDTAS